MVLVNDKSIKANYKISPSDIIEVQIPVTPHPEKAEAENIPIEVIYEDAFLLVVNKPAGMVAHPSFGNYTGTLVNALLHHTQKLSTINEGGRPGIIHRLDKDTSGLLVVAKDDFTHAKIAEQFARHKVEKIYTAVCWGLFKNKEGIIEANITRSKSDRKKFTVSVDEGKPSVTLYKIIEEFEFASLLDIRLKTGRTHQIRVHFSSINHPVFGDATYGGNKIVYGSGLPKIKQRVDNLLEIMPRQALHARMLGFTHPQSNEFVKFEADLPEDIKKLLNALRK